MKKFWCITFNPNVTRTLYFNGLSYQHFKLLLHLSTTSSIDENTKSSSLLFNYLINSLGFSKQQSLSTYSYLSKQLRLIQNTSKVIENATRVANFFKHLGFHDSDFRSVIIREPRLLTCKVSKTLEPKINLLLDLGLSRSDLVNVILRHPMMLRGTLDPGIHAFRTVLGCDQSVVNVIKVSNRTYFSLVAKNLIPNVKLLRDSYGIPLERIQKVIVQQPKLFARSHDSFRNKLITVEEKFGIKRDSGMFFYGLHIACYSDENFEDKCRVFRKFGWTDSDVFALIRRNPLCFTSGEGSINEKLEFLMNELGFKPDYLASQVKLLTCSIKKRVLPRYRVLEILKKKGVVRMDYPLVNAVSMTEPKFLKRFVVPFEEVHKVYAQLTCSQLNHSQ